MPPPQPSGLPLLEMVTDRRRNGLSCSPSVRPGYVRREDAEIEFVPSEVRKRWWWWWGDDFLWLRGTCKRHDC